MDFSLDISTDDDKDEDYKPEYGQINPSIILFRSRIMNFQKQKQEFQTKMQNK